jgi:hypothetical protein
MADTIDSRVGLLGVKEGGFTAGKLKLGPGISRLKAGWCGVIGSSGIRLRRGRRKRGPIGGAHMAATQEGEGAITGMHKPEEKAHFGEYAKASQVGWAEWGGGGQPDPMGDFKWKLIFEFQLNLDFGKNLRISTRRFRRNLDIRIFPKFC